MGRRIRPIPLLPRGFKPVLIEESSQCIIRIAAGVAGAAYMFTIRRQQGVAQTALWLLPALVYALFGYLWIWVTHYRLGTQHRRVMIALSMDQALIASFLHFGGEPAIVLAWGMPFASIGHGLRFGPY